MNSLVDKMWITLQLQLLVENFTAGINREEMISTFNSQVIHNFPPVFPASNRKPSTNPQPLLLSLVFLLKPNY